MIEAVLKTGIHTGSHLIHCGIDEEIERGKLSAALIQIYT